MRAQDRLQNGRVNIEGFRGDVEDAARRYFEHAGMFGNPEFVNIDVLRRKLFEPETIDEEGIDGHSPGWSES